uniref:Signal peptidase complex catalytic subunit SEC11 n=1 Tax=Catharus ustulatus TaxID=91951 RepID=A0A8C3U0C3_CATUS
MGKEHGASPSGPFAAVRPGVVVHLAAEALCASAGRERKETTDPGEQRGPAVVPGPALGARVLLAQERRDPRRGRHGSVRGPAAHEQAAAVLPSLKFCYDCVFCPNDLERADRITGSESPIVVVLSGSMEPAFHRGDLLFLTNFHDDPIRAGEIVVFKVEGRDIPIVHRVIKVHEKGNGNIKFLTKGDNNEVDDRGLYKEGQNWLEKKDVVGRARGFLPYVGMVTIIMNDYPKFKDI